MAHVLDTSILANILKTHLLRQPTGSGRSPVAAWASTRGKVRDENQDRLVVAVSRNGLTVAALADGMGGMRDGSWAAAVAASSAVAFCLKSNAADMESLLAKALTAANDDVFRILRGEGGAALVLAAWTASARFVAHAGDARAYLVTNSGGLEQLTVDDTLKGQLQHLGRSADEGAALHSQLLQFIGVGDDFEPHVRRVPDGRGLLLTSDGVHNLPTAVMQWVVKKTGHLQKVAERLVAASEWDGGHDNGTVVSVGFQADRATEGVRPDRDAEFWTPGDHVVLLSDDSLPRLSTTTIAPTGHALPIEETKSPRAKKERQRRSNRSNSQKGTREPPAERQVPIAAFGDDVPRPKGSEGDADIRDLRGGDADESEKERRKP